ncbi:divalent-cation tolerance protein CutA [Candidatus Gottesmanbacteria bacterium]|nr:divalent-cation tolerance protein CutA [Candidatus Gottesmanbacteria bacterium]
MKQLILTYITCQSREQAEDIGRHLLKKRLVGCINIIDGVHSMYFWPPGKNRIEKASETILLCHALASKYKAIEKEIMTIHSYSNPALYEIPISHVSKKYHDWLLQELR